MYAGCNRNTYYKFDLSTGISTKNTLQSKTKLNKNCIISAFCHTDEKLIVGTLNGDIFINKSDSNTKEAIHLNTYNPVKQIVKLNENQILVSNRQSDYICLWDLRKLDYSINSFYRKNSSNQTLEMSLYKNKYLATASSDGTIIVYDIKNLNTEFYFYENLNNEAVSSVHFSNNADNNKDAKLLTSNGEWRFNLKDKEQDNILQLDDTSIIETTNFENREKETFDNSLKIWSLNI